MAKKKMTEEEKKKLESQRKLLEATNKMLGNSITDALKYAERTGEDKSDVIKEISAVSDFVVAAGNKIGATIKGANDFAEEDKLLTVTVGNDNGSDERTIFERMDEKGGDGVTINQDVVDWLKGMDENQSVDSNENVESDNGVKASETIVDKADSVDIAYKKETDGVVKIPYDVIPLPSNGETYKNRVNRVQVEYLTAYDENMITSPNLYRDGMIIDFLLKNKVKTTSIDTDDLVKGDVDAITLWLRATSYGSDFPIKAIDPKTGVEFETTYDLSKLKYKEFNLKGDENGNFTFECPVSKDVIKFRYLTRKDERRLEMVSKIDNNGSRAYTIDAMLAELTKILQNDETIDRLAKMEYMANLSKLDEWSKKLKDKSDKNYYNKFITNRTELSIVSVNGNTNRQFIHTYVMGMLAKDSLELRKYMIANEPGIDWEIELERPANLGGGSFKTFLDWGNDVFVNI